MKLFLVVSGAKGQQKDQEKIARYFQAVMKGTPITLLISGSVGESGEPMIRRRSLTKSINSYEDIIAQRYECDLHVSTSEVTTEEKLTEYLSRLDTVSQDRKSGILVQSYRLDDRDKQACWPLRSEEDLDEGVFSFEEGLVVPESKRKDGFFLSSDGPPLGSSEAGSRFRRLATR